MNEYIIVSKKGLQNVSEILPNTKSIFSQWFRYFLNSYLYNEDVALNPCQYKNYNHLQA